MEIRELPRNPKAPNFTERTIQLLTELCFRHDDPPQPVDLIFVFSGSLCPGETADRIVDLLHSGVSKRVFLPGGIPTYADSRKIQKSESELILDFIPKHKFPDVQFFTEQQSRNTLENVEEALEVFDFRESEKIFFVFKAHAAGRGYLTLRRFLPHALLLQRSFPIQYEGVSQSISRDSWHTFAFGRERVWGEYLRIKKYGERGDIAFDEVRESVRRIAEEIDE